MAEDMIPLGEKLRRRARATPDAPAVSCGEITLTCGQLEARANRIARALHRLGVKVGDLITIGLPNGTNFVEACWGVWKLGATPQPVSFRLPSSELEGIVDLAAPRLVIALEGMETNRRRVTVDDLLALSDDDRPLEPRVAPILKAASSGGSTGRPKLILSGSSGLAPAKATDYSGGWRFGREETALIPAPLYHNGPFGCALETIVQDGHLVLMPRFDAEGVLIEIERRRATWVYMVPTMMTRIWRLPEEVRARYDVSSVRTLWHLAAPCPPWLKEAFIGWFGPDVIMELYGGTESQAWTNITGREWLEHRGSVGRVIVGEMSVFDADGKVLPAGEMGEVYMRRSEGSQPSYQYRGATARALPGGWESLGDIGYFDADGYLYLADRRTDMILVGGANVYPAEVEAAIDEHPLALSSAVVGLPHEDLGSSIHAIVQARPGLTAEALLAHLADRLVPYKCPRTIEFVEEPLRDDAGKVRRTRLRDERVVRLKIREGRT
ncbi:AMP-binding protein [Bradyrhizobium canariense]|uniref:AMP-binding protein n=1 Tax=Bradyrhizobium canariense TaxID=255045 RepID=UPI000A192C44|nr:AMP-binding protein [Bradyrhizobium canariense]OSI30557.1 acid--CoA ligase [Bradyrhizobium canariense]OSI37318.1 acid--CoA ligase [Bradyrhizobium canariense]OSI52037.1 acid--CoA ligase [Bradyrhizobium canariense]OSI56341.1 acid--CoA ligase [Bradyrhizobium canariense]OSI59412.1 acid--CoA ligase [Bradyrhizobium canariense]